MNIGFDLDNTLIKTDLIIETSKELGYKKFNELSIRDWQLSNFPNDLRLKIIERFSDPYWMCDRSKIIPGVDKKIKKLSLYNNLNIITARSKQIRKETKELVKRIFPSIKNIYFVEIGRSKENYFKKLALDVWIDDSPHDTITASKMGIKTYLICNKWTPYNFHIKNYKNIHPIKSIIYLKNY